MSFSILNRLQVFAAPLIAPAKTPEQVRAATTVEKLRQELPELLAVAVIDIQTSKTLAAFSCLRELAPARAAVYNVEVVRQKRRALEALGLANEKIEDILITLREQLHLLRVSQDGQQLLYLVVNTHDTNLAIARTVLRAHSA
ncbi:hypothetical protein [Hymenobacter sp.]|jgi:hypothetical protein|uniref:hypothetical protein n=1 Tax=Hymenobacter sp. TaxID=1898978 RepID=UPI002EDA02A7